MISPRASQAARRLADQQSDRLAELPATRLFRSTVTTVTAGAAVDGSAVIAITWHGQECTVADYPDSYAPASGDRVMCALVDGGLSVLHHCIGTPSSEEPTP